MITTWAANSFLTSITDPHTQPTGGAINYRTSTLALSLTVFIINMTKQSSDIKRHQDQPWFQQQQAHTALQNQLRQPGQEQNTWVHIDLKKVVLAHPHVGPLSAFEMSFGCLKMCQEGLAVQSYEIPTGFQLTTQRYGTSYTREEMTNGTTPCRQHEDRKKHGRETQQQLDRPSGLCQLQVKDPRPSTESLR